ncbi:hypothetical protein M011DRAFT_392817, partial [Sporormia fimetaria CBS 119925]
PPIFKAPRMISRPKPKLEQEEELGADPKLGDFEGVHPLSVSEARAVINAVHEQRRRKPAHENTLGPDRIHNDSASPPANHSVSTINQWTDYVEVFSRYKQTENLHAISSLMDSHGELTPVEKALLGSLACDTADEAKTLIPSLANKISDSALQSMLDQMAQLR